MSLSPTSSVQTSGLVVSCSYLSSCCFDQRSARWPKRMKELTYLVGCLLKQCCCRVIGASGSLGVGRRETHRAEDIFNQWVCAVRTQGGRTRSRMISDADTEGTAAQDDCTSFAATSEDLSYSTDPDC
jgi:hypothetical protein